LKNVTVQEAAKEVLGDIAGVNYTVDPRIENKISVQTSRKSSRAEIIDLFLAALRTVGVVVIQNGPVYRVTVADQQASTTARFSGGAGDTEQIGSGSRYFPIKHVSAAELRRVLEPMSATGAVVQVDEARNTLIVTGTSSEVSSIQETIALFDTDQMKGMSFALVPIAVADPDAIVDDLQKIFTAGREAAMSNMVQFIPQQEAENHSHHLAPARLPQGSATMGEALRIARDGAGAALLHLLAEKSSGPGNGRNSHRDVLA
jgi:general secretion pathway protein D